uniref:Uncharacterized protein n=1 Tax=Ditylenchus dipsaci TaxID=166011 RepID=A0A915DHC8_9BILA
MPSLMTSNIAQPLYSQAVYEPRGLNSPGTQEHNLIIGSYDQSIRNSRRKAASFRPLQTNPHPNLPSLTQAHCPVECLLTPWLECTQLHASNIRSCTSDDSCAWVSQFG